MQHGVNCLIFKCLFYDLIESVVVCRVVYPPVFPVGGSDLFPAPGAGMYPPRYLISHVIFLASYSD